MAEINIPNLLEAAATITLPTTGSLYGVPLSNNDPLDLSKPRTYFRENTRETAAYVEPDVIAARPSNKKLHCFNLYTGEPVVYEAVDATITVSDGLEL